MPRLVRLGRIVSGIVIISLALYLWHVGLPRADMIASCVAAVAAVLALVLPHLVRSGRAPEFGSVRIRGDNNGGVDNRVTGSFGGDSSAGNVWIEGDNRSTIRNTVRRG